MTPVRAGLDVLVARLGSMLAGRRVGLLCHQASVTRDLTHAFLRRAHVQSPRHNPGGAYVIIGGRFTGKRIEDGRHLVGIEQEARNQDGEQSVVGGGVVELPSRG